jgi:hypothetical protein
MSTEAKKIAPGGERDVRKVSDAVNQHATILNTGLKQSRTVAELALETPEAGREFFCTDESGGAVPVFCDGLVWRRMTDRAVAS